MFCMNAIIISHNSDIVNRICKISLLICEKKQKSLLHSAAMQKTYQKSIVCFYTKQDIFKNKTLYPGLYIFCESDKIGIIEQ